jgi:tetratricopeptide (TPR) repeat protein
MHAAPRGLCAGWFDSAIRMPGVEKRRRTKERRLPGCYDSPVPAASAKHAFSREEARRALRITERQLRSWERQGLVAPSNEFAFTDLVGLQTLVRLRQQRVPPARIRKALAALRQKLKDVRNPLTDLKIYADGSRIRVDLDVGTMEPVSGQLLLNFDQSELRRLLSFPAPGREDAHTVASRRKRLEAELLFEKALEMEHNGSPVKDVIEVYEHAISLDPRSTGALVNLGTIYFNARSFTKAETYYRRALEIDSDYALAHFNLANLYDERGERAKALHHYLEALKQNSGYADAHYNLALLYQSAGETMKAVRHWQVYLKLDPASSWAAIARRELERLKSSTIVQGGA